MFTSFIFEKVPLPEVDHVPAWLAVPESIAASPAQTISSGPALAKAGSAQPQSSTRIAKVSASEQSFASVYS